MAGKKNGEVDEDLDQDQDETPGKEGKDDDETEVVKVGEDDEGEGDPEDDEPPKPGRKERRKQRGLTLVQQAQEEARQAREEARAERERANRIFEQALTQRQAPGKEESDADPLETEKAALRREKEAWHLRLADVQQRAAKGTVPQAEIDKLTEDGYDLDERIDRNKYARFAKAAAPKVDPRQQAREQFDAKLTARHPELADPDVKASFMRRWPAAIDDLGDDWPAVDLAMAQVRKRMGLPARVQGREQRTEAERRRFTGVPRGAGSGDSSGTKEVRITKEAARLRDRALSHIKDIGKRNQAFAKMMVAGDDDDD